MLERAGYLKNHWQGLHSIPRVVWINLFAFSLIVSVLLDLVPEQLNLFQIAIGLLLLNSFLLWQMTGAFRTLKSAIKNQSDIVLVAGLSFAMVLVLTVSLWRSYEFIYPVPAKIDLATTNEVMPLDVSQDQTTIFLEGDINYALHASFLKTLEDHKDIKTIALSSEGGIIFAARAIANKIIELNLNTKTNADCFSACTLIFLAGKTRQLADNGQLGFHLYATKSMLTASILDIEEQVEKDKQYLRDRGVSEGFITTAYTTPPEEIWVPTRMQLQNAGILAE